MRAVVALVAALALTGSLVLGACAATGDDHDHVHTDDGHTEDTEPLTQTGDDVLDYCDCMLNSVCHDLYHEIWTDDEIVARETCIAEAEALPESGDAPDAGNSLECRLHWCLEADAAEDEALCQAAAGLDVCL